MQAWAPPEASLYLPPTGRVPSAGPSSRPAGQGSGGRAGLGALVLPFTSCVWPSDSCVGIQTLLCPFHGVIVRIETENK